MPVRRSLVSANEAFETIHCGHMRAGWSTASWATLQRVEQNRIKSRARMASSARRDGDILTSHAIEDDGRRSS
jgi:hypothetical protein